MKHVDLGMHFKLYGGLFSFSFDFLSQLIYAQLQIVKILRKEMIMRLVRGWVTVRM